VTSSWSFDLGRVVNAELQSRGEMPGAKHYTIRRSRFEIVVLADEELDRDWARSSIYEAL
jgi:hypothetical protein